MFSLTLSVRELMDSSMVWGWEGDWLLWKNTWQGWSTVVTLCSRFSRRSGHATTFRSEMAAVNDWPLGSFFITSSHCVVITRAGASARVRSATKTISGFFTTMFISVLETTGRAGTTSKGKTQLIHHWYNLWHYASLPLTISSIPCFHSYVVWGRYFLSFTLRIRISRTKRCFYQVLLKRLYEARTMFFCSVLSYINIVCLQIFRQQNDQNC